MTFNQVTGKFLTLEEIKEAVASISSSRKDAHPFDVAVNGELPADPGKRAEMLGQYREAGATWWMELAREGESFEEYRKRIQHGPPH